MTNITFKGQPVHTTGSLLPIHSSAPAFTLVTHDLRDQTLADFSKKRKILATVPSLDTGVCGEEAIHLHRLAKQHPHILILIISADLPFAQKRFCTAQNMDCPNLITLSMMRNKDFGKAYGVLMQDGPLAGLLARSLIILDEQDRVVYVELVPEITEQPNYDKAFHALTVKSNSIVM